MHCLEYLILNSIAAGTSYDHKGMDLISSRGPRAPFAELQRGEARRVERGAGRLGLEERPVAAESRAEPGGGGRKSVSLVDSRARFGLFWSFRGL